MQLSFMKWMRYLSLTLEHGSIDSSLAATRATQPSVILFKYTKGVLPINYNMRKLCLAKNQNWEEQKQNKIFKTHTHTHTHTHLYSQIDHFEPLISYFSWVSNSYNRNKTHAHSHTHTHTSINHMPATKRSLVKQKKRQQWICEDLLQ